MSYLKCILSFFIISTSCSIPTTEDIEASCSDICNNILAEYTPDIIEQVSTAAKAQCDQLISVIQDRYNQLIIEIHAECAEAPTKLDLAGGSN